MIKVCLTHDIDRIDRTYQYITKPLRAIIKGSFTLFASYLRASILDENPYWGFDQIIEIENKYQVKSTLFFLDESIKFNFFNFGNWKLSLGRYRINDMRIKTIMCFLDENGWEIGVHGSYNSYNNYELLKKEKLAIEEIVGHKVSGIRQHYLNLSMNTWKYQEEVGFLYDSTWGLTNDIGFKEDIVKPFYPNNTNFCVIPQIIMDYPFVNISNKWNRFGEFCDICEENHSYLVINFHNSNFYSLDNPKVKDDYIQIIERLISKRARFITMEQAYAEIIGNRIG